MADIPLSWQITIRVPGELAQKLKDEADRRGTSPHALVIEAIRDKVDSTQVEE